MSNLNYKKILFVTGFILICLALTFAIYWMFFRSPAPQPGDIDYVPPTGQLPETGEGTGGSGLSGGGQLPYGEDVARSDDAPPGTAAKIEPDQVASGRETWALPITSDAVVGMTLSNDQRGVAFYEPKTETFYKLSADGQSKLPLSDEKFHNVEEVVWSADSTKAVLSYPDGIKLFYDFSTRQKTTLPSEVNEVSFSSGGDNLAFKFLSPSTNNNFIAVAKPDGTAAKYVENIGNEYNKMQIDFSPTSEVVAFYGKPIGINSTEVFLVGQNGENFRSFKVYGTHFKAKWSPSGQRIIYHVADADQRFWPSLWTINARGDNIGTNNFKLNINTWVDRCLFASESEIFCAVPTNLDEAAGLYVDEQVYTNDQIYKIDLKTGVKNKMAIPFLEEESVGYNISKIALSSDGNHLFFQEKNSQKIYTMQLK